MTLRSNKVKKAIVSKESKERRRNEIKPRKKVKGEYIKGCRELNP